MIKKEGLPRKKVLCIAISTILLVSLAACGAKDEGKNDAAADTSADASVTSETQSEDAEAVSAVPIEPSEHIKQPGNDEKIDKTVDAVAAYLGFTDGKEVYYSMIGAIDGKEFNDGELEIYLYDESSEAYQSMLEGKQMVSPAAYKDGVVLVFPNEPDQDIIDQFNKIVFN